MLRFWFSSLKCTNKIWRIFFYLFILFLDLLNKTVSFIFLTNLVLPDSVPELIFWHIPSQAYKKIAPRFGIHQPCVGLINKESVASQEAELGIMDLLVKRPSVKVSTQISKHGTHNYIHFKNKQCTTVFICKYIDLHIHTYIHVRCLLSR